MRRHLHQGNTLSDASA
ncbi:hypothetical protein E2C01_062017 [Portunus trituberculatus]|uniref:Uncharacterized protein n=1 Tax=Portunus trituberculatus TaxID=210409 RepID=A0A5B7H5D7_PORTR|nr:hypothetical protein [Portunus trituberculatus]